MPNGETAPKNTDWEGQAENYELDADDYAAELRKLHEELSDLSLTKERQSQIEAQIQAVEEARNMSEKYAEDAREMSTKNIKPPKEGAASMDQNKEYYTDSQNFVHSTKEDAREADAKN